jgi:hypothetical protein
VRGIGFDDYFDLAKHAFSLAYKQYLTLIFHTLGRPDRLLSGVRTSENQITPGAQLYMPVRHQWANSVHCVCGAFFARPNACVHVTL